MKKKEVGKSLQELTTIIQWFEKQSDIDVEQGLEKVREGAVLIKELRSRLKQVENEFEEIKKDLAQND